MANNLTNYSENKLVDHLLGTTAYTKPTSVYVALYTSAPGETATGTEATGGSYARQLVTFAASSNGTAASNVAVSFASMPACTIVAIGITDAVTSGNLLLYGNLASNVTLVLNDTLQFPSGSISVSLD